MNRIKELRIEQELSQSNMAENLGISRFVLANYEREINQPAPDMLIKIADFFGVSIDYLLGREDDFGMVNVVSIDLSDEEKRLLQDYRSLAEPLKKMIRDTISTFKTSEQNTQDKRRVK